MQPTEEDPTPENQELNLAPLTEAVAAAVSHMAGLQRKLDTTSGQLDRTLKEAGDNREKSQTVAELNRRVEELSFSRNQLTQQLDASRFQHEQLRQENQRLMRMIDDARGRLEKLFEQIANLK